MQRYTIFFITVNAAHVSGGFSAHHQELKNCTQHRVCAKLACCYRLSCNTISIDEFVRTMPVRPPVVNRNTNPSAHKQAALYVILVPYIVASHLKILIPVGTAIIRVG